MKFGVFVSILAAGIITLTTPVWAGDKPMWGVSDLAGNFHNFSVKADAPDLGNYVLGPEEKAYLGLLGKDGAMAGQRRFADIKDAGFEQLFYNISADTERSTANPDAWLFVVHYPQNTGHTEVDADLKAWAKQHFMDMLGVDPEKIAELEPFTWLEERKKAAGDNHYETLALMEQSFAFKTLVNRTLKDYKNWRGAQDLIIFPSQTVYLITRPTDYFMSVVFVNDSYSGGAHGMTTTRVRSYNLDRGQLLTLQDLLPDAAKATPLIQKRLGELAAAKGLTYDNSGLFENPAKMKLDMSQIALAPEGLVFIYDPYQIAPYAQGTIMLTIPKAELKDLGVDIKYWR